VAALQGDTDVTIDAFNRALKIRNADLDARQFIGEQFWAAGNLTAALEQFEEIATSNAAKRNRARAAEARRLQAEVLVERGELTEAREALEASLTIEKERQNFEGMAKAQEKLGDTFVSANRTAREAREWYALSLENYLTTRDKRAIARLRRKLSGVRSEDTYWSKLVEQVAQYLIERVARRLRALQCAINMGNSSRSPCISE
jgi:tetratricopeptide (TPR) repeat protein